MLPAKGAVMGKLRVLEDLELWGATEGDHQKDTLGCCRCPCPWWSCGHGLANVWPRVKLLLAYWKAWGQVLTLLMPVSCYCSPWGATGGINYWGPRFSPGRSMLNSLLLPCPGSPSQSGEFGEGPVSLVSWQRNKLYIYIYIWTNHTHTQGYMFR